MSDKSNKKEFILRAFIFFLLKESFDLLNLLRKEHVCSTFSQ